MLPPPLQVKPSQQQQEVPPNIRSTFHNVPSFIVSQEGNRSEQEEEQNYRLAKLWNSITNKAYFTPFVGLRVGGGVGLLVVGWRVVGRDVGCLVVGVAVGACVLG